MNVTRSEKTIIVLICLLGWVSYSYYSLLSRTGDSASPEAQLYKHQLASSRYDDNIFIRKVNDDIYEYRKENGKSAFVTSDASFVFYGDNIQVDEIVWSPSGLPEAIINLSLSPQPTLDHTTVPSLSNFGSNKLRTPIPSIERPLAMTLEPPTLMTATAPAPMKAESLAKETAKEKIISTFDCDKYKCKEGDIPAYPLPHKALSAMNTLNKNENLLSFTVGSGSNVDLAVLWDVNCPKCKNFYSNVLRPLIKEDKTIRVIAVTNESLDRVSNAKWRKITDLFCDESPLDMLKKQNSGLPYLPKPKADCELPEVKAKLGLLKSALSPFGLGSQTPISFTKEAMLYGALNYEQTKRYL